MATQNIQDLVLSRPSTAHDAGSETTQVLSSAAIAWRLSELGSVGTLMRAVAEEEMARRSPSSSWALFLRVIFGVGRDKPRLPAEFSEAEYKALLAEMDMLGTLNGRYEVTPISAAKLEDASWCVQLTPMAHEQERFQSVQVSRETDALNSRLTDWRDRLLESAGAAVAANAFIGFAFSWFFDSSVSQGVLAIAGLIAMFLYVLAVTFVKNTKT